MKFQDQEIQALGEGGFICRDGFLGDGAARAAHADAAGLVAAGRLRPARLGRGADPRLEPGIRGDELVWLDAGAPPALATLRARLLDLRTILNESAYLGLGRADIQLATYPGGGARYARHRDAFAGGRGDNRRITALYYLNPDWRPEMGGHLRLHLGEAATDVEPVLDRLVVFRSEAVEHEVLPAHAPRLAVTAWYY